MTTISHTYNVYDKNGFLKNLNKIVKRYKAVSNIVWAEPYEEKIKKDFPTGTREITIQRFPVTVEFTFDEFKVPGYTYLGAIKDETMMGLITIHGNEVLGGQNINDFVRTFDTIPCHNCNRQHKRKIGHLFRHDANGEILVFGSSCAKNFFGVNFDRILGFFEFITNSFSEGWDEEYVRDQASKLIDWKFAAKAAHFLISKEGYLSVSKAKEQQTSSTADTVRDLHNYDHHVWEMYKNDFQNHVSPDMSVLATTDYSKVKTNLSDFEYNIQIIQKKMAENVVTYRKFGMITYMVFNQFFREVVKKDKVEYIIPEWATPKTRIKKGEMEIQATVNRINSFSGAYGLTYIYTFVWDNVVRFQWFTSTDLKVNVGDEVIITAFTVKEVKDDQYGKSVIITRVTISGVNGKSTKTNKTSQYHVTKQDREYFERMGISTK